MVAGRFAKHNGATEVIDRGQRWSPKSGDLWRFTPDEYHPFRKPIRSPNLLTNRAEVTFGKRVVDAASKQVARRAPLALAGPLGDLLALGLITWDMYLLLLELQNNANPVMGQGAPADPNSDPYGPPPYDLSNGGWYQGQTPVAPPAGTSWVQTGDELAVYWNNPRMDFPNLGASWTAPGDVVTDTTPVDGNVDSISYFVPVHNTTTLADGYWHTHSIWWIDYPVDPATTFVGHGVPLADSLPLDWAEPDPNMKRNMFPDGMNMAGQMDLDPQTDPRYKRGPRFRPPKPSRPAPRTRERKMKGPLNTILGAMDIISEAAEFVGALYDALPEDVRHRWEEKNAGGHWAEVDGKWKWIVPTRGLLDNAGQYGIDGADWKARALWHNWHKLDIEQGIKNIIANELQDKILGMYQRSLPKNIGHAADAGSMGLNDLINLFNETIGLS